MNKVSVKSKRKKLVTVPRLVIFCLLIIVLIMGAWVYVRNSMLANIKIGIANLESQNYQIGHNEISVSGFPFLVSAVTRDVTVQAPISDRPDITKNWKIKLDGVQMSSATLSPLSWRIEHRGQARIDMHGSNGERYTFDVTPATIDAQVDYTLAGALKVGRIVINHAQIDSLVGTPPIISQFEQLGVNIIVSGNTGQITLSGMDVRLSPKIPNILDNMLGRKLAFLKLDANLENWPLLETEGIGPWIAANNNVASKHWAIKWGRADMIGTFDITFKNGLPEGIVQIRIKNPEILLQGLIDNKLIPEQYAGMAKTLIALQKPEDDNRKSIEITIKDGLVKIGFIPIYKF